jgi:uncharacterized protein (DUF58 family)
MAIGMMGYLATKHGDDVTLLHGDSTGVHRLPIGQDDAHLERLLRAVSGAATLSSPTGDLGTLLDYAGRVYARHTILVCVTDVPSLDNAVIQQLRRLRSKHDIMWIGIGDSDLRSRRDAFVEVDSRRAIPDFVLSRRHVRAEAAEARLDDATGAAAELDALAISHCTLHREDDILPEFIAMLSRRGYARGR